VYKFDNQTFTCKYTTEANGFISQQIDTAAKEFSALANIDVAEVNTFTPTITTTITADGVANPTAVTLGTAVEVSFGWSPTVDGFYIDSCTASGLDHTQTLVENGCVVMSSASFMSIINPVLADNGQTLQFNQFAFSSGNFGYFYFTAKFD